MSETFRGKIVKGDNGLKKLELASTDYFKTRVQKMKAGEVKVTVDTMEPLRSGNQNNFYWLYLTQIAEETGHAPIELHAYFRQAHLSPKVITVLGKEVEVPKSTTALTKSEMTEYMFAIEQETGVPIPNPQDAGYLPH